MIANSPFIRPVRAPRVLVVEDGAIHQKLAKGLLSRHGCTVTIVGNGRAALQAVEDQPFDLILMDVEMPEMDGVTATRTLRRDEGHLNQHTHVVGVSSSNRQADCLDAGMNDYMAKPLRDESLVRVLEQIKPRPIRKTPRAHHMDRVERCNAPCP